MNGRTQTGLVGCASVDDYTGGVILKHENTLEAKELDRFRHIDICSAQTGPIFLAYRPDSAVRAILHKVQNQKPLYDFTSEDHIRHSVWRSDDPGDIGNITHRFSIIPHLYTADGHHRAAPAVKAAFTTQQAYTDMTGDDAEHIA